MRDALHSRRAVLKATAATASLGAIGSLAGCSDGSGTDPGGESGRIDRVPAGSSIAAHVDVGSLLADDAVRETVNELIEQYGISSVGVGSLLDRAEQESGLDPRELSEVLVFGDYDRPDRSAAVLWSEWSAEDLLAVGERTTGTPTEDSYKGATVYHGGTGDVDLAVLGDGAFAVGPAPGIEAAIDVREGDADPVGGDVREAYASSADGHVRWGFSVPTNLVPEESGSSLDLAALRTVTYGYGSLTGSNEFRFSLRTDGDGSASEVADLAEAARTLLRTQLSRSGMPERGSERVRQLLDNTSVSRQGRTVTITNSNGAEAVALGLGAVLGSFVLGLGNEPSATAPQVAFEFEYDPESGELTITHTAGDFVAAGELYVRGEGTPTGSWAQLGGSASGEVDGQQGVAAGDSLTLSGVGPGYEVSIVWESDDGNVAATLAEDSGPEA